MYVLDLGLRDTPPHCGAHLYKVELKPHDTCCRNIAPDKRFSLTAKCGLDLLPRDQGYKRNTTDHNGKNFYQVILKSLNDNGNHFI